MTGKKKSELSSTLLPDFLCNCIQYSTTFPEMQGFLKYMPDSLCKDAFRRSPSAILQPGYLLPSHLPRLHHLRHFFCDVSRRVFRKIFQYFICFFVLIIQILYQNNSFCIRCLSIECLQLFIIFFQILQAVLRILQTFCQDFDLRFSSTTLCNRADGYF
jgi:hypothetical protein